MARVVFDFDGTIADSMWVVISIYEKIFSVNVPPAQIERIRGMSAMQAIKTELKVPMWRAPKLLAKGKKIMKGMLPEVKVFGGLGETIKKLHAQGNMLEVMSSNSEENVRLFLKANNLEQYFTHVHGNAGLFGKAPILRRFKKNTQNGTELYYVGDEARDVEAAKKASVPVIAVGWGYNTDKFLKTLHPDYFAAKPQDILDIIGSAT